jgi:hypothetical protein
MERVISQREEKLRWIVAPSSLARSSSRWHRAARDAVYGRKLELQHRRASTATYAAWSNPQRRPKTRLAWTPRDDEAGLSAVCHPREAPGPQGRFRQISVSLIQDVCLLPRHISLDHRSARLACASTTTFYAGTPSSRRRACWIRGTDMACRCSNLEVRLILLSIRTGTPLFIRGVLERLRRSIIATPSGTTWNIT